MNRLTSGVVGMAMVAASGWSFAQESFRVELGRDGETIGDMRPVFLEFKTQPMPAISPVEVARRYQKLFDSSGEPEVRIDALARLSNIQRYTDEDVSISQEDEQRIYREAIQSYDAVINRGSYHGKLDELLYQMAKAHSFIGQVDASTDRLKQLVGLYPSSELVPEARFRIAESAFAAGEYEVAEVEYSRLISGQGGDALKIKARYMLGWSQYKQGPTGWRRAAVSFLTVLDGLNEVTQMFSAVSKADAGLIEDTFRIVALMAAEADGVSSIASWAQSVDSTEGIDRFSELLFDRLADLYATRGHYQKSVDVGQAFIDRHPDHSVVSAFYSQAIDVWRMAGQPEKVWSARADYVAAFSPDSRFARLEARRKAEWLDATKQLADYHYDKAQSAAGNRRIESFEKAANYYAQLAPREAKPGETLRLEGDAWLQAGQHNAALAAYEQASYDVDGYENAADAGWAGLLIRRDAADKSIRLTTNDDNSLAALAIAVAKWAVAFPADNRVPQISSDVANRLLRANQYDQARGFADTALTHPSVTPPLIYSALLIIGETHVAESAYGLAENTWRKALELAQSGTVADVSADDVRRIRRQLATSIFDQGRQAAEGGKTDIAVAHFQRIDSVLPGSEIAIKGRFDAANTLLAGERWLAAINELSRFRQDFPGHELTPNISDKLVYAYTSADKPEQAADELMAAAVGNGLGDSRRLRAAQLYHDAGAMEKRNRLYVAYLDQPASGISPETAGQHVQIQTMRQRLIESGVANRFREQMIADELASQWHSDETLLWAGEAAMYLGEIQANLFAAVELRSPLPQSLQRKKGLMDAARERYAQAEQLANEALVSQTTFRRAELYRSMAIALMESEAPPELNEMETMQYQMLLEEEAYPFEEQAIALHERNHQQISSRGFNPWIEKSLEVLAKLHPGRYNRTVRWMSWNEETNDGA